MLFIFLQNSPTDRSPCSSVRRSASKLESASLGVLEKLGLESKPGLTCGGTQSLHDVMQI
jgi:hypothetical protein